MKQRLLTFILISFAYSLAFGQMIDAGTYPGMCPGGTPITLTGTVSSLPPGADDYCTQWVEPNGNTTDGMELTVSPTMTTTYTFEVTFNNGDIVTDDAVITVCEMEIHPVDADFAAGHAGKVLVWTDAGDNNYRTIVNTSKANKPAQSEDHKVHVTVHLKPAAEFVGRVVNFKLVTPDLDDESSYEPAGTGDNKDMAVGAGDFGGGSVYTSAVTTSENINGVAVAAAEVELTITSQYAGDNYQVEASLDPFFSDPAQTMKTSKLVAWKRAYIEEDNMYEKGATLTMGITVDADAVDDVLTVDDASDFTAGDMIRIFDNAGGYADRSVISKTATTITVADMAVNFDQYAGIRIIGQDATYSLPLHHFPDAYGVDPYGTDGGTFLEFEWGYTGSGNIPKYTAFPNDGDIVSFDFCDYWFSNSGDGTNIFQLVAAASHADGSLGTARSSENICFVTIDNHSVFPSNIPDAIANSAVHEIGHQFHVSNSHVDQSVYVANHETPSMDACVMSYAGTYNDGDCEFDTDCIYDIRDGIVPR